MPCWYILNSVDRFCDEMDGISTAIVEQAHLLEVVTVFSAAEL
jgi:hypothetical protein